MLDGPDRLPSCGGVAIAKDVKGVGAAYRATIEALFPPPSASSVASLVDTLHRWIPLGHFAELDDSVSRIVERAALGKGNYDRKVFNNIWGTFTFGPDNTVYLGAYRGFLRFWSDSETP
jgi:hypothetical protein